MAIFLTDDDGFGVVVYFNRQEDNSAHKFQEQNRFHINVIYLKFFFYKNISCYNPFFYFKNNQNFQNLIEILLTCSYNMNQAHVSSFSANFRRL